MRRVHEGLEVVGRAVRGFWREPQHAVVAPAAGACEFGHRHELDEGHPERDEVIELVDRGAKRTARRERADVQLVDDGLVPRPTSTLAVAPRMSARVNEPA